MYFGAKRSSGVPFLLRILAAVLLGVVAVLVSSATHPQRRSGRPRVGLVMNGDGAVGFAQIGVLQWLEEHRIPVDYIAGTGVGSLIGGGYAAGKSPADIRQFIEQIDFSTALFLGDAPYQDKGKWGKPQLMKLPGIPGIPGLELDAFVPTKIPDMIVPLLPGIGNAYRAPVNFDDLPTPFRCLTTDLRSGELVEFATGSLPDVLRACVTFIGVSTPVRLGEKILVSGSIINSIPVDTIRQRGADVVIVSYISPRSFPTAGGDSDFASLTEQMERSLEVARERNDSAELKKADVLIRPKIGTFNAGDLNRIFEIEHIGYVAAEEKAAALRALSASESEWQQYLENRYSRKR